MSAPEVAARVSAESRPGARSSSRPRDSILRHVYGTEPHNLSATVEARTALDTVLTPHGLAANRAARHGPRVRARGPRSDGVTAGR